MTQYKVFYEVLQDLALLFDAEKRAGGHEVAIALKVISVKSHTSLPPPHHANQAMIRLALLSNPHEICTKILQSLPVIDWRYVGSYTEKIPDYIAKNLSISELVGPNGMIYHDKIRVGLVVQAPHTNYTSHNHSAEESLIILGGTGECKVGNALISSCKSGDIIHRPANVPHLCITKNSPMIAAWRWTGDIDYKNYTINA